MLSARRRSFRAIVFFFAFCFFAPSFSIDFVRASSKTNASFARVILLLVQNNLRASFIFFFFLSRFISVPRSIICWLLVFFFSRLKLECEKLASEKTEMQRHYVMVRHFVSSFLCLSSLLRSRLYLFFRESRGIQAKSTLGQHTIYLPNFLLRRAREIVGALVYIRDLPFFTPQVF